MTQRTRSKELVLFLLLISPLLTVTVQAEVSSLEIVPEYPSQGDVVTIRISAQPEEKVAIIISFSKTLSVVDGKYEWILEDVYVPSMSNRVSVTAENVANVHMSVKILLFWITKSATATDGVVTMSQGNVPKGTYDLTLHGDALPNASAVTLDVTASATVKMDSEGIYDFSYNTSNIPLGTFRVEAGSVKKTVTLNEKGPSPPPAELAIRDLSVYPPVSTVGSEIRVTAMIINTGERLEDSMIGFSLDGEPYFEEQVSLEPGESRYLDFRLTGFEEGWHILTVMDSSQSFVVIPAQAEDTVSRVFEQLKGVPSELAANILDSVSPRDTSNETAWERELGISEAVEVIESAIELGLTSPFSTLLLNIEKDQGASLLISVDPRGGSALLKSMYETDPQSCAALVEAATSLEITGVVEILDLVETDLLSQVLLEIARLPSTPSTVTRLLEEMSVERVMAVVRSWIGDGHLRELGLVLEEASEEMLNSVTGNLEKEDQLLMLSFLRAETFARIDPGLLILPDLSVTDVSVNKIGAMRFRVTVDIRNTGVEAAAFDVTLTVEGARIDTFTVDELRVEEEREVEFEWEPEFVGAFRIEATVDRDNDVFEINELDNMGYLEVVVEKRPSKIGLYLTIGLFSIVIAGVLYRKFK